ncbi:MAG TPA: HTTM domain-containing protein, partial [Pirellulales bacterium]|nr:HTTM domain-containing protein [Pirellulales bacterium]
VGLWTRVTSILALVAALSYVGRVPGALFGLDQINVILAAYLAVGPSGSAFSLDRWLARRRAGTPLPVATSWTANLAIRLIQIHMCIIYLFAGTAKLTGPAWWDGTALWMALGNMEYQSMDMTWLANWPRLINAMTHVTIYWEIFYCALIWPRLTRPVMLLLAIPLHMGIAICLGMTTFGLVMLIGNMAFIPPALVRACLPSRQSGQGRGAEKPGHSAGRGPAKGPSAKMTGARRDR